MNPEQQKSALDKAQETLATGHCDPDEAQRVVRKVREQQENGGSKEFNDTIASLKGRKFRLRRKRRRA